MTTPDLSQVMVPGDDGAEHAADPETLRRWISEGRIASSQRVLDVCANRWRTASALLDELDHPVEEAPAHGLHVIIVATVMLLLSILITPRLRDWIVSRKAEAAAGVTVSAGEPEKKRLEALAVDGSYVYAKLLREERLRGLHVYGRDLILEVPNGEVWDKVSDRDKVALSYFIQSQLAVARETPRIFERWGSDTNAFTRTCPTCWYVSTERRSRGETITGGVVLMSGGERIGANSTAQEIRARHGVDAAELTWVVAAVDPRRLFRIAEGYVPRVRAERRDELGYFRVEEMVDQTPLDAAGAWKVHTAEWPRR